MSISGMEFTGQSVPKGKEILDHLFNVKEEQVPGKTFATITAQILRSTSVTDHPYSVVFEVDSQTRQVQMSRCSCVSGENAHCKHGKSKKSVVPAKILLDICSCYISGACLYHYVNQERTEGKTDAQQRWSTPSKKLQDTYPKGQTVQQILGKECPVSRDVYRQHSQDDEVLLHCQHV
jgi:hypothetical protein